MSKVKIVFSIFSDDEIDFKQIDNVVGTLPTSYYSKGEKIREGLYTKEYAWILSLEKSNTYELDHLFEQMFSCILNYNELCKLINDQKLTVKFDIVINEITDTVPSIYLSREIISKCNFLNAEVDIDVIL